MTWGPGTLYSIDLPYACFAIVVRDGKVTFAAPIGRWMVGKSLEDVELWVRGKRGEIGSKVADNPTKPLDTPAESCDTVLTEDATGTPEEPSQVRQ